MSPRPREAHRGRLPAIAAFAAIALAAPSGAPAQQFGAGGIRGRGAPPATRVLEAARVERGPNVDGHLGDTVWQQAAVTDGFTQQKPSPGTPSSERTEVRVLVTDDAIYVGARLHDADAGAIVGRLGRRDGELYSDWFLVQIDSDNDRRTAFVFGLNPAGVQRDFMRFNDVDLRPDWDAVWAGSATVDSGGWSVELRIPLSQLRFARADSTRDGGRRWGVNFEREIARRGETSHWAPIPPNAAGFVSLFGELRGLRHLRPSRRLELRPYTAARGTRAPGSPADPFYHRNDVAGSVGTDLKYGVTPGLTLSATINPDFGQVEADPSQVNLTAFELWLPEQRPFFLEGADLFETGYPMLFYSRRVGRAPRGRVPGDAAYAEIPEATSILTAAKLTGKTAGWSVAALDAVTGREHARYLGADGTPGRVAAEPLTNYAVARVGRDFRRGRSRVGAVATATTRQIDDAALEFLPRGAYVGGVDGSHRFAGGDYQVSGVTRGSYLAGSSSAITRVQRSPVHYFQRSDADHLTLDTTRTSLTGAYGRMRVAKIGGGNWRWEAAGEATTPGFEVNDLGYQYASDELVSFVYGQYGRYRPDRHVRRWSVSSFVQSRWSFGSERTGTVLDVTGSTQLQNFWDVSGWVQRGFGGLSPDALWGGPALVRPGATMGYARVQTDHRRPLIFTATAYARREDQRGGGELTLAASGALRYGERMELSLRPRLARVSAGSQFVTRQAIGDSTFYLFAELRQRTASLTARLSYTFTPTMSLQFYAQPFVSAGGYRALHAVLDPRGATRERRFRYFADAGETVPAGDAGARAFVFDVDGDGASDATVSDPSFNVKELRSNLVLRWEYRPGSTLFAVWQQGRSAWHPDGSFDLGRDTHLLLRAPSTNVLMVKATYWMGL